MLGLTVSNLAHTLFWCFLNTRHVGDLGNVTAEENGVAEVSLKDSQISLSGAHSIVGRTMVVSSQVLRVCGQLLPTVTRLFLMLSPGF